MRVSQKAIGSPWIDSAVIYRWFLATNLLAFWISRHVTHSISTNIALDLIPYLTIFTLVMWRRSRGRPFFRVGSLGTAFGRAPILWILAAGIATYTAHRSGIFGPHSMGWRVYTFFSDSVETPLTEEFAFRGAILTALNMTRLGTRSLLGLQHGTLVSAIAFASVHLLALFNGMPLREAPAFVASAFGAGIVFGYFYQRTQNLWYGIFIHALGNFSQILP